MTTFGVTMTTCVCVFVLVVTRTQLIHVCSVLFAHKISSSLHSVHLIYGFLNILLLDLNELVVTAHALQLVWLARCYNPAIHRIAVFFLYHYIYVFLETRPSLYT